MKSFKKIMYHVFLFISNGHYKAFTFLFGTYAMVYKETRLQCLLDALTGYFWEEEKENNS